MPIGVPLLCLSGKQDVSPIRGSYKAMLAEFGREHIRTFDLLIANQHISSIVVFRRSSFVNVKQLFWDTYMGSFCCAVFADEATS